MIRIRFHGRGGHGTKTASRVVGTAAFLSGFHAQDSPIYGAERRGAAVVAFTRVNDAAILERGVIEQPDLIVLADETLLETPGANVLGNQDAASAIFINTTDVDPLISKYGLTPPVVALDLTSLTLHTLGPRGRLDAGLAAAAIRMIGIDANLLASALEQELSHLRLPDEEVQKNIEVARQVFAKIDPVAIHPRENEHSAEMVTVCYRNPVISSPSVLHVGNAIKRHTGAWRVERPQIDRDICTRCGLCFVRCPDGAIALDEHGYPVIDYDHCKGCMICHHICPLHAIESEKETRAW